VAGPFQRVPGSPDASSRLLGRRSSVTLQAIEDLLARADCVRDVTSVVVSDLCAARNVDLRRRLSRGRRQLYHRYLKHCFEDKVLTPGEIDELSHLRGLLHLDAADLVEVHDAVAVEVYGEAVEEVLADFRLDDDEAAFLRGLRESLDLSEDAPSRGGCVHRAFQLIARGCHRRRTHQGIDRDSGAALVRGHPHRGLRRGWPDRRMARHPVGGASRHAKKLRARRSACGTSAGQVFRTRNRSFSVG